MNPTEKKYTNGEITVVWKPDLCTHACYCWRAMPEVFNPNARPWINVNGASQERIIAQVNRCPSKALTWYRNDEGSEETK
jgi:uncharacterized Fe-S cluster protein YjdI